MASYPLKIARNGFKPLNGSEWGSKKAEKEMADALDEAQLAKAEREEKERNDAMFATMAGIQSAIFEYLHQRESEFWKAIERGAKSAIERVTDEEVNEMLKKERRKSLDDRARESLKELGYSDEYIEKLQWAAKLFTPAK